MSDSQKMALRPILVRPLIQTFAVIVMPSESELNRTWRAQVFDPFQKALASKAPFAAAAAEASAAEIGQVFGPDGAIAKFVNTSMGPLVVRRGDVLTARTWADIGISLAPQTVAAFPGWIAPLSANGVAASTPQTVFQLMPLQTAGVAEFTVEVDGQQLRYRNTVPAWTNMVHPAPQGVPGARISAVTADGRTVELLNELGPQALKRMIETAVRKRKDGGVFELRWSSGAVTVALDLKVISTPDAPAPQASAGFRGLRLPAAIVGRDLAGPGPGTIAQTGMGGAR
jgi:type VI secretion system protein ImpL